MPANNYGQTKAVAALVTGIAQDKGYLEIDAPIGTYLPPGLGDAAHRAVTVRNLLQEASGIRVNNVRGLNFYADQSRPREFFVMDFAHQPGTYFEYDEIGPSLLTYVVQRAIWRHEPGVDFQVFAQRELFDRIGIPTSAYFWQRDRAGNTEGYSQLFLRPLEFGRLGQLWLTDGVYQGTRVISQQFMREFRTIANSGPYDRLPQVGADLSTFVSPLDAAPGTYLSIGPGAPQGCNPLGCQGEPNDGVPRYVGDIPRTIPGILGEDDRHLNSVDRHVG